MKTMMSMPMSMMITTLHTPLQPTPGHVSTGYPQPKMRRNAEYENSSDDSEEQGNVQVISKSARHPQNRNKDPFIPRDGSGRERHAGPAPACLVHIHTYLNKVSAEYRNSQAHTYCTYIPAQIILVRIFFFLPFPRSLLGVFISLFIFLPPLSRSLPGSFLHISTLHLHDPGASGQAG